MLFANAIQRIINTAGSHQNATICISSSTGASAMDNGRSIRCFSSAANNPDSRSSGTFVHNSFNKESKVIDGSLQAVLILEYPGFPCCLDSQTEKQNTNNRS